MESDIISWGKELASSKKAVVVEGLKDKKALNIFGVFDVFVLSKKPLYAVVEEICSKACEVVILTDLDRHGKMLYGRLKSYFEKEGCRVDSYFREFLQKNTKVSCIEGLPNFFACQGLNL